MDTKSLIDVRIWASALTESRPFTFFVACDLSWTFSWKTCFFTTDKRKCIKVLIPQQKLPQSKYKCKHMHTDWKFLIDMDTYASTVKEKQAWVGRHWNVLLEISSSQFILWWLTFPLQINWCLSGFGFVVQLLEGFKINRKQNVSPFTWSKSYDLLMINIKEIFPLKNCFNF